MLTEQFVIVNLVDEDLNQDFPENIKANPLSPKQIETLEYFLPDYQIQSVVRSQASGLTKHLLNLPDPLYTVSDPLAIHLKHPTLLTKILSSAWDNDHYLCDVVAILDNSFDIKSLTEHSPKSLTSFGSIFWGCEFILEKQLVKYLDVVTEVFSKNY